MRLYVSCVVCTLWPHGRPCLKKTKLASIISYSLCTSPWSTNGNGCCARSFLSRFCCRSGTSLSHVSMIPSISETWFGRVALSRYSAPTCIDIWPKVSASYFSARNITLPGTLGSSCGRLWATPWCLSRFIPNSFSSAIGIALWNYSRARGFIILFQKRSSCQVLCLRLIPLLSSSPWKTGHGIDAFTRYVSLWCRSYLNLFAVSSGICRIALQLS